MRCSKRDGLKAIYPVYFRKSYSVKSQSHKLLCCIVFPHILFSVIRGVAGGGVPLLAFYKGLYKYNEEEEYVDGYPSPAHALFAHKASCCKYWRKKEMRKK